LLAKHGVAIFLAVRCLNFPEICSLPKAVSRAGFWRGLTQFRPQKGGLTWEVASGVRPNLVAASIAKCLTWQQNLAFCTCPSQVMRQLLQTEATRVHLAGQSVCGVCKTGQLR